MGSKNKSFEEKEFQERYVNHLTKHGWDAPDELNGNKHAVYVSDLIKRWRGFLNKINADQLEGVELTDNEFSQVMSKVNQIHNSYEAAKLLAVEDSTGKIDGIYRDPHPNITRQQITLTIFKKKEVKGGDSTYDIAREVRTDHDNRFDLVLLINGIPLINIELKRTDKSINDAFEQFQRYYHEGEYTNNFMAFSQMMVVSTEIETRYFATPKSYHDFNLAFTFHWADVHNHVINDWKGIIETFLKIPMAHQMVGDYAVIDEANDEENRRHMLLRPYQVNALRSIEFAALGRDKEKGQHGGFIWHTTGSGKTITSFKTAMFLSTRSAEFDNVVFLVDRRELDQRTTDAFKAFAAYEAVEVTGTYSQNHLKRVLSSYQRGIVVTTTFKLHNLVKELIENKDHSLSNKRFVFIIDEAHRTTLSSMMLQIKGYFKKNSLFYGFTGTPIYDENKVKGIIEKSEVINTTEKLFGPLLHSYTIDQAIADKNVLGFHVDFISTGEFISYEDLREQLVNRIKENHPDKPIIEIEREVSLMSNAQIENEDLFIYQDETHIPAVVGKILDNWDFQSQECFFNAILTVKYKQRVIDYYLEFKKQLEERSMQLNVAMTFSFGEDGESNPASPEFVNMMFKDYEAFTGIGFISGDHRSGEDAYFADLVVRGTRGGSSRNATNIDLIIVADQLLTGYDSKYLNTLYVDRKLELHSLIQAYSRTNRVLGPNKEFGTTLNFMYPAMSNEYTNEALKLYGTGGGSSSVIVDEYELAVKKLSALVPDLIKALDNPSDWQQLELDDERKKGFIEAFSAVNTQMKKVEQYYEYQWDDETFGMSQHLWLQYIGAYRNLMKATNSMSTMIDIIPLPGRVRLVKTQVVTASYILSLIGDKMVASNGVYSMDDESLRIILEHVQELSNMGQYAQAELLKEYIQTELVHGVVDLVQFEDEFAKFKESKLLNEVNSFAGLWGLNPDDLIRTLNAYDLNNEDVIHGYDELVESVSQLRDDTYSSPLLRMAAFMKGISVWLKEMKRRFGS